MSVANNTVKLLKEALNKGISLFIDEGQLRMRKSKGIEIDPDFLELIKNRKSEIEAWLKNQLSNSDSHPVFDKITPNTYREEDRRPLSFAQKRLWFTDQYSGSSNYHQHAVLNLKGALDVSLLETVFNEIINRHEILRGIIIENEDHIAQVLLPKDSWSLEVVDLVQTGEYRKREELLHDFIKKPFDLSTDYMLRAKLIKLGENDYTIAIVFHHIASDAWSEGLFIKEFVELYNARRENRESVLPEIPIQFSDFANWEQEMLSSEILEPKLNYWESKLTGVEPLNFSFNYGYPDTTERTGRTCSITLDKQLCDAVKQLANKEGVTLFMFLLSVYKILLHRYTGQTDFCVGTSFANRNQPEVEHLIGNFVELLALRDDLGGNPVFRDLLAQVKTTTIEAFANKEVPFNKVVDRLRENNRKEQFDLFRTLFVLNSTRESMDIELHGLKVNMETVDITMTHFDLCFYVSESDSGITIKINYFSDLFTHNTIKRLRSHFKNLVRSAVKDPGQRINSLQMLSTVEQTVLLYNNKSTVDYPEESTMVEFFEANAESHPGKVAAVYGETEWTYQILNEKANRIARYLKENYGSTANQLVGVMMDNPMLHLVTMLGIWKSGAAYVPVDPNNPADRIRFVVKDAGILTMLVDSGEKLALRSPEFEYLQVDRFFDEETPEDHHHNPGRPLFAQNLAYVIYTSGTTGMPKGVMVSHQNIMDYVFGLEERIRLSRCQSFGFMSSLYADLGNTVFFASLFNGGTLHLFDKTQSTDPAYLHRYFNDKKIDCIKIVPSHWNALEVDDTVLLPSKMIIFGGEALLPEWVQKIKNVNPNIRVINHYGPTETTIGKLLFELDPGENYLGIPIGKPFSNTEVFVVNSDMELCPIGVAGELLIGGDGVANGYLNRPDLTAEKFIVNPFDHQSASILYKTGDLVKRQANGNIEFVGRVDDQVKIRGYRVELGAVEATINTWGGIKQSVVQAFDKEDAKQLIAYIVPTRTFDEVALKEFLNEYLPDYMIPGIIIKLDRIPVTANGKTDKAALPLPERSGNQERNNDMVLPETALEGQLAEIWKELLDLEQVGVDDHFFDIGGHSLVAIRVVLAVRKTLGVEMSIKDLFEHPTISRLAAFIRSAEEPASGLPEIKAEERTSRIPLSFSQERLWIINELEGSTNYHIDYVQKFDETLDTEALHEALKSVVDRHEVLRTVFWQENGTPYQKIMPHGAWQWEYEELNETREKQLTELIKQFTNRPFDLEKDPMIRAKLFRLNNGGYILNLVVHHIASDFWSQQVMFQEVLEYYQASLENRLPRLKPLAIQYADYAIWQRKHFTGPLIEKQLAYWKTKLAGLSPLNLPTTYRRPGVLSKCGKNHKFSIDRTLSRRLKQFCQEKEITVYMLVLTVFKLLLYKYTGQRDICVGSPVANRTSTEMEGLIGFFLNALALRTSLEGNPRFNELLGSVKETVLESQNNQLISFEKVVENLVQDRDTGRSPLFQVWFDLHDELNLYGKENLGLDEGNLIARSESLEREYAPVKFDLDFITYVREDGIEFNMVYPVDLFSQEAIVGMGNHFLQLLQSVVEDTNLTIDDIEWMSRGEVEQLTSGFNTRKAKYPVNETILDEFARQVEAHPDKTAVVCRGKDLTYRELDRISDKLARHLVACYGINTEDLIGVMMERSEWTIVSILGIIKAGAAYVPIAIDNPPERKRFIINDTGLKLLLIDSASIMDVIEFGVDAFSVDLQLEQIPEKEMAVPVNHPRPSGLAYVIYTSGTSGRPKGVLIEHRGLLNLSLAQIKGFALDENSRMFQFSSIGFDASCSEIFTSLLSGGTLYIPQSEDLLDPRKLSDFISRNKIDIATLPPSYQASVKDQLKNLKTLVSAGEMLNPAVIEEVQASGVRVINAYGPTENTVCVSMSSNPVLDHNITTIGQPIENVCVYILKDGKGLMPVGIPGEICVGGPQVARGYLNRDELTAQKFIPDPFTKEKGQKLYRTGDLGRWLADGNIEYLGRVDDQVKIRGFRIELGEINVVLNEFESIQQGVVIVRKDENGNKRLVAYTVPCGDTGENEIQAYLRSRLPEFMVPDLIVQIDEMPLTSNGKVNIKALPRTDTAGISDENYVAPRNETEQILAEIWQELLQIDRIGIFDNFFELGGDSIICIQLVSRAREKGVALHPKDVFEFPVIAQLGEKVAEASYRLQAEQGQLTGPVPLLPIQQWFFEQDFDEQSHYNQAHLFKVDKSLSFEFLDQVFKALLKQHDALRLKYTLQNGNWKQEYSDCHESVAIIDLEHVEEDLPGKITETCRAVQKRLNIEDGILVKAVHLKMPKKEQHDRFFIVVHHLAVDGVSWRILLHQFQQGLQQLQEGRPIDLGVKTSSYREWGSVLEAFANSSTINNQRAYWQKTVEAYEPLPVDFKVDDPGLPKRNSLKRITSTLSESHTKALLSEVHRVYQTEINDFLLAALAKTMGNWTDHSATLIGLEGHGRGAVSQEIDTSSTVGWFTAVYPVLLRDKNGAPLEHLLLSTKDQLRNIPEDGIGFSLLRHLNNSDIIRRQFSKAKWDIVFNYLGQTDNIINADGPFEFSSEDKGPDISGSFPLENKITINCMVHEGVLGFHWGYSSCQYQEQTIRWLAAEYLENLTALIEFCQGKPESQITPTKFGLDGKVSYETLNKLIGKDEKEEGVLRF